MDIGALIATLQSIISALTVFLRFFCWLDTALGLNIIPVEFCDFVAEG